MILTREEKEMLDGKKGRAKILYLSCMMAERLEFKRNCEKIVIPMDDADWFLNSLSEGVREKIALKSINAYRNNHFPAIADLSGIIIGGSEYMLSTGDDRWVGHLKAYVTKAAEKNIPLLGICFGHQLLAQVFGSEVRPRRQREFGKVKVTLSQAGSKDKLFHGIDTPFEVLMSHNEVVDNLTNGMRSLAFNDFNPNQAIGIGDHIRGVQFHPEFSKNVMEAIWHKRKSEMDKENLNVKAIKENLADTPAAKNVLDNFIKFFGIKG